jgi:hypothetical protein
MPSGRGQGPVRGCVPARSLFLVATVLLSAAATIMLKNPTQQWSRRWLLIDQSPFVPPAVLPPPRIPAGAGRAEVLSEGAVHDVKATPEEVSCKSLEKEATAFVSKVIL